MQASEYFPLLVLLPAQPVSTDHVGNVTQTDPLVGAADRELDPEHKGHGAHQTPLWTQAPVTAARQERTYFQYPSLQRCWEEEGLVFAGARERAHQLGVGG